MFLYFDRNRVLKEIVNNDLISVGDSNDKIYIYVEELEPDFCYFRFKLPDGGYLPNITANFYSNIVVTTKLPLNKKRDLKFFNYNDEFKFVVIDLSNDPEYNALSQEGVVACSVTVEDDGLKQLGLITFDVAYSVAAEMNEVEYDGYVSLSQFNYLLDLIDEISGQTGTYVTPEALAQTLTSYVLTSDLNSVLLSYVSQDNLYQELQGYVQDSDLDAYAKLTDLNDYATVSSLNAYAKTTDLAGYVQTSTLTNYVTTSALTSTLSNYVQSSTLANYVTSSDLSVVLASYVSNNSLSSTLTNYVTTGQLNSAISAALSSALEYKGEATVATLNGYGTSSSNGNVYVLLDSGTLTQGSVTVIRGDLVAWNAGASKWDKLSAAIDLSNYVTTTSLNTTLQDYVLATTLGTTLQSYVTSSSLSTTLQNYATQAWVGQQGFLTSSDLSGYVQTGDLASYALLTDLDNYVTKETGKGLSSNDFTTTLLNKLNGIASGAQVNVLEGISINGSNLPISGKVAIITGLATETFVTDRVNKLAPINLTSLSVYTFLQTYGLNTEVQAIIDTTYAGNASLIRKVHVESTNIYSNVYNTTVIIETDTSSAHWAISHTGTWDNNESSLNVSFQSIGNVIRGQTQTFGGNMYKYDLFSKAIYKHEITISGTMLTNYFKGRLITSSMLGTSSSSVTFGNRELGFSSSSSFTITIESNYSASITSLSTLYTVMTDYNGKVISINGGFYGTPIILNKSNSTYSFYFKLERVYPSGSDLYLEDWVVYYNGTNVSSMFTDVVTRQGYLANIN